MDRIQVVNICYIIGAHQVADHGEQVDGGLLVSDFIDADLRVWYTSAVPGLDEGLVLLEAVATSRS